MYSSGDNTFPFLKMMSTQPLGIPTFLRAHERLLRILFFHAGKYSSTSDKENAPQERENENIDSETLFRDDVIV